MIEAIALCLLAAWAVQTVLSERRRDRRHQERTRLLEKMARNEGYDPPD